MNSPRANTVFLFFTTEGSLVNKQPNFFLTRFQIPTHCIEQVKLCYSDVVIQIPTVAGRKTRPKNYLVNRFYFFRFLNDEFRFSFISLPFNFPVLRFNFRVCSGKDGAALGLISGALIQAEQVVKVRSLEESALHGWVF